MRGYSSMKNNITLALAKEQIETYNISTAEKQKKVNL